ncbi:MAG: hypothetical protein ACOCVR_00530 [Myxococcota bacterium]
MTALEITLSNRLSSARRDARKTLKGNRRKRRVSLVFLTPRLAKTGRNDRGELSLEFAGELLHWARNEPSADFVASWVPEEDQKNPYFITPSGGWIPGVFVVGKMHSKAMTEIAA